MKNTITITYADLQIGDIIYWYGALVKIIRINRFKANEVSCEKDCTYFEIEPVNEETIKILGTFYSHGSYGGIDTLTVYKVI